MASANILLIGQPAQTLHMNSFCRRVLAEFLARLRAVRFAESMAASGQRHGFFRIHRHAAEGGAHVPRRLQRIRIAARTFGIDVDQAHLDRSQRPFKFHILFVETRLRTFIHPYFFGTPECVAFGCVNIHCDLRQNRTRVRPCSQWQHCPRG